MQVIGAYRAHTNIALIKYWGKRHQVLHLPVTNSLSLTLEALYTDTAVEFDSSGMGSGDVFYLNGERQSASETEAVSRFVDLFRELAGNDYPVRVDSVNHVPTAAGLASSASAFAALACACDQALGLGLSPEQLSVLARRGSGSASRSLFAGFAEWDAGQGDDSNSSYAHSIDPADWDIGMLIVVVNAKKKKVSSRQGMQHTVETSPFYALWPQEVARDLDLIRPAIQGRDIQTIGQVAEHNAMKMHATMLASNPSFNFFEGDSLLVMDLVQQMRADGLDAYYTMDAGPNVKIICPYSQIPAIKTYLEPHFHADQLIASRPGSAPTPIDPETVRGMLYD